MVNKILGIRAIEGTSKKTGKPFDAYILNVVYETPEVDAGMGTAELFLDKGLLKDAVKQLGGYRQLVGQCVDVDRNASGFVVTVRLVE